MVKELNQLVERQTSLKGKRAVVSVGTTEIGRATTRLMLQARSELLAFGRDGARLGDAMSGLGDNATGFPRPRRCEVSTIRVEPRVVDAQ